MPKDMFGSLTRALVGIPDSRFGVVADAANHLSSGRGDGWSTRFTVRRKFSSSVPASAFARNEYGHVIITITGLNLTGADEIKRLEEAGYRVGDYAKSCFASTETDDYDKNHHLVAGQVHKIALIPGKEIARDCDRTTTALRKLGEKYGYGKPLAGHVPRIRESVSDKQMEEMGIWYIASLHEPIKNSNDCPRVLNARRGRWVNAYWDNPYNLWFDFGAFAFPVPAN
jgi:hypothetical protein